MRRGLIYRQSGKEDLVKDERLCGTFKLELPHSLHVRRRHPWSETRYLRLFVYNQCRDSRLDDFPSLSRDR